MLEGSGQAASTESRPRASPDGNTRRAVRPGLAIYCARCREQGVTVVPASARTVAAFVDAMAKRHAPATVRRYVSSTKLGGAHDGDLSR